MIGYLSLGGGPEFVPEFGANVGSPLSLDPIGQNRGRSAVWHLPSVPVNVVSIPARDKELRVIGVVSDPWLRSLSALDTDPGLNYRSKLQTLVSPDLGPTVVQSWSSSGHHSIAVLTGDPEVVVVGLYDTKFGGSYLFWADEPALVSALVASHPLRFLVYRFPSLVNDTLFAASEQVCSHWWRWIKRSPHGPLQPFNALERKLMPGPSSPAP